MKTVWRVFAYLKRYPWLAAGTLACAIMKSAFEQIYGPPYLARMLFAEVGARPEDDLFLRVEYDGEIASNGATYARARQDFAVLSGTRQSVEMMEAFLKSEHKPDASFETTVNSALDACHKKLRPALFL